jgi:hypothetical protein
MTEGLPFTGEHAEGSWDRFAPDNASPVVAWLCSAESAWLSGAVLRIEGDVVQRLSPWDIDATRTYRGEPNRPVDATALGLGLRTAFRAFPSGLPSTTST